jgi:[protein-PII] uridylyltransferase
MHQAHLLRELSLEESARAAAAFREILLAPTGAFRVLNEMNELGVLRTFLPEFEHLYCRIQHDTYHIYTADVHLLFCVKAFGELRAGLQADSEPELTEIAASLPDPWTTALAVLLHDIGKGYGVDHSEKGAELAADIANRLGLEERQRDRLTLLVRRHLLMSHTAQRRDLSDADVIRDFARSVGDSEVLDMLLILTYCDQKGVGPGVWTPWKRSLLLRLYKDARRVLDREDIQGIHRDRIRTQKRRLRRRLEGDTEAELLTRFLREMPPRFFLRHDPEEAEVVYDAFREGEHETADGIGIRTFDRPGTGTFVVLSERDRQGPTLRTWLASPEAERLAYSR